MRPQPQFIHLGAQQWQVRPLTLAQVQAIEPLLAAPADGGTLAAAIAILRIALSRDHAEAASQLESIEAGAPEIAAAMATVLRLGGFLPNEGIPALGEAGAGSAPAASLRSTGPTFTPD